MLRDADGAHPRAAAAVRNAEGLVQVQVTDIRADVARSAEADLGVHVGAIHVDLPAVPVHCGADLLDRILEHAVRRGIGHHQRRKIRRVLCRLRLEVGDIDVPLRVRCDHHHTHSGHHCARRIGAVRAHRNQTDIAMQIASAMVVATNRHQAGELAL